MFDFYPGLPHLPAVRDLLLVTKQKMLIYRITHLYTHYKLIEKWIYVYS